LIERINIVTQVAFVFADDTLPVTSKEPARTCIALFARIQHQRIHQYIQLVLEVA
jgi:hypothetical protein